MLQKQLNWLEGIELTVRQPASGRCQSRIREFFSQTVTRTPAGKRRKLKRTLGRREITSGQAEKLAVLPARQLSPDLENCWLRLSPNVSDEQAEPALAYLTGIGIAAKTQQRLVHHQTFALPSIEKPPHGTVRRWWRSFDGERHWVGAACEWRG